VNYTTIDRWLVHCEACGNRWAVNATQAPTEHHGTCTPTGQHTFRRGLTVERIIHRRARQGREHCRMAEPKQIPPPSRSDRDGACSWNCRGSQSATCYCPCGGEHHATTSVVTAPNPEGGRDVMDMLIARTPTRDFPRRARKST
jgi:hypothetical protein